jgi:MinD superfamily P-loop ATPase
MMFLGLMVSFLRSNRCLLFRNKCANKFFSGAKKKCAELGITLLGDIPLHPQICSDADAGKPTVVGSPDSPQAEAFTKLARELKATLDL